MHMTTDPYLLPEDRPEFERALNEALLTTRELYAPASDEALPDPGRLRTMALSAVSAIAACAAVEYQAYVALRGEQRSSASSADATGHPDGADSAFVPGLSSAQDTNEPAHTADTSEAAEAGNGTATATAGELGEGGALLAGTVGEGIAETAGAGLTAMVSVLVPVLAGTAAVIFLLLGYLLHLVTPEPAVAAPVRTAGWVFAAVAVAGAVVAMAGLWVAAYRNGSRSRKASRESPGGEDGPGSELSAARAVWREALLERGILPFLSAAVADPHNVQQSPASYVLRPGAVESAADSTDSVAEDRTPRLGYSGPEFSSRTSQETAAQKRAARRVPEQAGEVPESARSNGGRRVPAARGQEKRRRSRPRFSSPDFSSPDYGGPDDRPD